jgi:hypothetical protein
LLERLVYRSVEAVNIDQWQQPGDLTIAQLNDAPSAIVALSDVDRKEPARYLRQYIREHLSRRKLLVSIRALPVRHCFNNLSIEYAAAILANDWPAARWCYRLRERLVGAKDQPALQVVAAQGQEVRNDTLDCRAITRSRDETGLRPDVCQRFD